jgi:hypothetical protein
MRKHVVLIAAFALNMKKCTCHRVEAIHQHILVVALQFRVDRKISNWKWMQKKSRLQERIYLHHLRTFAPFKPNAFNFFPRHFARTPNHSEPVLKGQPQTKTTIDSCAEVDDNTGG